MNSNKQRASRIRHKCVRLRKRCLVIEKLLREIMRVSEKISSYTICLSTTRSLSELDQELLDKTVECTEQLLRYLRANRRKHKHLLAVHRSTLGLSITAANKWLIYYEVVVPIALGSDTRQVEAGLETTDKLIGLQEQELTGTVYRVLEIASSLNGFVENQQPTPRGLPRL